LGFGVEGLGFRVWGLGFGVWGLGFGVWGCTGGRHDFDDMEGRPLHVVPQHLEIRQLEDCVY
jgi:hypothetical protein